MAGSGGVAHPVTHSHAGHAAGARRAPAALLCLAALLTLALPAAVYSAPAKVPRPIIAPTSPRAPAPRPTEPVRPGVTTSDERPLRLLAAETTAVVVGGVTRSEPYDEDRL